jgi:hypothetical protein
MMGGGMMGGGMQGMGGGMQGMGGGMQGMNTGGGGMHNMNMGGGGGAPALYGATQVRSVYVSMCLCLSVCLSGWALWGYSVRYSAPLCLCVYVCLCACVTDTYRDTRNIHRHKQPAEQLYLVRERFLNQSMLEDSELFYTYCHLRTDMH